MCWTKKKIDSNYQLLHCIFHRSHHFQQELQKKSREPGISKQLITSRISKEQTALQQEIKSFKVVRSAPSLTVHHIQTSRPTPKRTHGLHPDRQEPCHSLHAGMCWDKVGGLSHNPETHQCILSSSGEPAGKSKLQPLVCSFRFYEDDFSASKAVRTGWQNLTFTNAQNKHCRREQ